MIEGLYSCYSCVDLDDPIVMFMSEARALHVCSGSTLALRSLGGLCFASCYAQGLSFVSGCVLDKRLVCPPGLSACLNLGELVRSVI